MYQILIDEVISDNHFIIYLNLSALAFIFEYDSEEEVVGEELVFGEIARGFPHPELSEEDPDAIRVFGISSTFPSP